ncbi:MAG: FAD-binding protein [Acutalibacteraceae bacterium]|nr:FAD-binding protein [Acutalibacteraceae bacterium]
MIIVNDLHLPLGFTDEDLLEAAAKALKIAPKEIKNIKLHRRSVDARHKDDVHFCCSATLSVSDEKRALSRCKKAQIFKNEKFSWPQNNNLSSRPVVVGFGPAGMFAALTLARAGAKPIVIERGEAVDERKTSVDAFFSGGKLNPESNVQFGEGGAGTFSDGKLNTGIKNLRCRAVLEEFVRFGADEDILIDAKPHVGTDRLTEIVKNLREEIISLGGEVLFSCRMDDIIFDGDGVCAIAVNQSGKEKQIECKAVILATGHSARDTFYMLKDNGVCMERKPFSVGARIEHLRADIDHAMYGDFSSSPYLSAADYKLSTHLENGKGVYTFCMCPGGEVINASSEENAIAVNGMSFKARDGINSNSALLADIAPNELEGDDILAGILLQRQIEKRAYDLGNGKVPTETVGKLLGVPCDEKNVTPTVKPNTIDADIYDVLPKDIADSLVLGIKVFGQKIKGFDAPNAVLTFPETRSSSPVRILRDEYGHSLSHKGIFPSGEGAGYAGGIMSAAVDGIKTAENVIEFLKAD